MRKHIKAVVISIILVAICCASASTVFAETATPSAQVTSIGQQGPQVYFYYPGIESLGCAWNYIYIDLTTDYGKPLYALLLTEKAAGAPLLRVDYTVNSTFNTCWAVLLQY